MLATVRVLHPQPNLSTSFGIEELFFDQGRLHLGVKFWETGWFRGVLELYGARQLPTRGRAVETQNGTGYAATIDLSWLLTNALDIRYQFNYERAKYETTVSTQANQSYTSLLSLGYWFW